MFRRDPMHFDARGRLSDFLCIAIILPVPYALSVLSAPFGHSASFGASRTTHTAFRQSAKRGQVAQVVERSPEKAGVGGSTPSLATMFSITYLPPYGASVPLVFQNITGPFWAR
jgi:hypothetical protein